MGRAFVFGDDINTDVLAPGHLMKLPADELARHCLEAVDPQFAGSVRPGDVVVGGNNFGQGSSREQAAVSLKLLGVTAVLARSFARIFYRNAINVGLPAIIMAETAEIAPGDDIEVDLERGIVINRTHGRRYPVAQMPVHLRAMVAAGGLIPHLEARLKRERA